jgi:hypothetical protein
MTLLADHTSAWPFAELADRATIISVRAHLKYMFWHATSTADQGHAE